jgi:polyhydroxybutyrate depolymerase
MVTNFSYLSVFKRVAKFSTSAAVFVFIVLTALLPPHVVAKEAAEGGSTHPSVPLDLYSRFEFKGQKRKYLVHLPPSYDGSHPVPLVLCLHGGGGDIGFARRMFKMNEKADKEGFIVAYPNGSGRMGDHILTWNAEECCGYAEAHRIDDVGFLRRFLHFVESEYNVDRQRVYVVGFSLGAMMTYRLAAEMPEEFAAFAVVSGSMNGKEPRPPAPISGLIIHGSADKHVPVSGGGGKLAKWGFNVHAKPLAYAIDFWVNADGCQSAPVVERNGVVEHRAYANGKTGAEIEVYTIDGYAHSWPGGNRAWPLADPPCPHLSATDKCWEFFSRHKRPGNGNGTELVASGSAEITEKAKTNSD